MDRLDAMAMAIAAVDEGSLAASARRFGRSAAAATRAIALLEEDAGESLLLRSTRGLRLTEAGERHVAVWRDVLARLADVHAEAESRNITHTIGGTLVLTAPELFGRLKVVPVLHAFLDVHPQVQARALLLNRVADMMGEGIDVAIRLAHLPESSLAAVKLGEVRRVVCASPAYLAQHGTPGEPADLASHVCIGTSPDANREPWTFRRSAGSAGVRSIPVQTRVTINSVAAALDAALGGRGLIRCMSYQAAEHLARGELLRVLTGFEPEVIPVNIVFRPHPRRWSPVRAFVDHAVPLLRAELTRIAVMIDGGSGCRDLPNTSA